VQNGWLLCNIKLIIRRNRNHSAGTKNHFVREAICYKDEEQEVPERTHPPLTLFNNAVINLNRLVQRFIRWDTQTNSYSNSLLKHDIAKITEFYTDWFSVCPNINILHHRHF
jgi:hypothetical protein